MLPCSLDHNWLTDACEEVYFKLYRTFLQKYFSVRLLAVIWQNSDSMIVALRQWGIVTSRKPY